MFKYSTKSQNENITYCGIENRLQKQDLSHCNIEAETWGEGETFLSLEVMGWWTMHELEAISTKCMQIFFLHPYISLFTLQLYLLVTKTKIGNIGITNSENLWKNLTFFNYQSLVSIQGPVGYGPTTLPLRHSDFWYLYFIIK